MKFKIINAVLLVCIISGSTYAQNNTSPYSIIGIGDIESGYYGRWSGMGNTGSALYSNRYLNQSNAASLTMLDDQFFNFEVSGRFKYTNYVNNSNLSGTNSSDISMKKLALGIKLSNRWGSGVGLMPFSSSNYSFNSQKTIQGSNFTTSVYNQGSGGLTHVYWANSYGFFKNKNLRFGLQAGYLFGSLNQKEELVTDASAGTVIATTRNIYMNSPYLTYSTQYSGKISNKLRVGLGGTYSAQTKLNAEHTLTVSENGTDLLTEQVIKNDNYTIPKTYTAGVSVTYNDRLTFASDYRKQDWTTLNYGGLNYNLTNSSRYSAGVEYSRKLSAFGLLLERSFYQAGVFYNKSYLQINNEQLKDYGITLGIGGNSKRNSLGYQLSVELGSRGTINKGLIKENYSQFTFTLAYRDIWFTKGRKYD